MPGVIGYSGTSTGNTPMSLDSYGNTTAAYFYTAVAGDLVDQFAIYANNAGGATVVNCSVYTVVAGLPANRVHASVPITLPAISGWAFSAAGLGLPLVAGTQYTICYDRPGVGGNIFYILTTNGTSRDSAVPLPAAWTHVAYSGTTRLFYANVIGGAAPASGYKRGGSPLALFDGGEII